MTVRLLAALCICVMASPASAQLRIRFGGGNRVIQQPHVDHHDRVIRDSHGHVMRREHRDVVHGGSRRVIPPVGGTHIDHHDRVVRDRHGHVIRREHHDVVRSNWSHVVPSTIHGYANGQYYVQGNNYYYAPRRSNRHVVAKPAIVRFGGFTQYGDLSGRLETLVNDLLLDLHYNYPHNPGFAATYREGYQLLGVAKYIHSAQHNNDRAAMRSQLTGADQLIHHIQDDVRGWTRINHHRVGTLGISSKIALAEATLHHLMNDVGVSPSGQAPAPAAIAPAPAPIAAPVPVGR